MPRAGGEANPAFAAELDHKGVGSILSPGGTQVPAGRGDVSIEKGINPSLPFVEIVPTDAD